MPILNETLKKKLQAKRTHLENKIQPLQEELDLIDRMLNELESHNVKMALAAEAKLGINNEGEK